MGTISNFDIKEEMVQFLRNGDVFSISTRGVATAEDTGTFASDSTHLIDVPNIKNIRSIVRGTTLVLGTDYSYDTDFDDSGTIKTKITFVAAQTGSFTITYDFGSDKIFPDYPKDSLSISSYPRIAVDIISSTSTPLGFGNQQIAVQTEVLLSIIVFARSTRLVETTIDLIRVAVQGNQNSFVNFKITTEDNVGPILVGENTKQDIFHRNIDFISSVNIQRP